MALRQWMNAHGSQAAPIDVNEFGACDVTPQTTNNQFCGPQIRQSSAAFGMVAAAVHALGAVHPRIERRERRCPSTGARSPEPTAT